MQQDVGFSRKLKQSLTNLTLIVLASNLENSITIFLNSYSLESLKRLSLKLGVQSRVGIT